MNIYISDVGIYKTDGTSYPVSNAASVRKINPLGETNSSTDSVARQAQRAYVAENNPAYTISISSMGRAAVQSMQKLSAGFESLREAAANTLKFTANTEEASEKNSIYTTSADTNTMASFAADPAVLSGGAGPIGVTAAEESAETTVIAADTAEEETETTTTSSVSSDLSRYTDYQLQQLLNEGSISRAEYNTELAKREGGQTETSAAAELASPTVQDPLMKQAVEAYNFQMSYQINALFTQ